MIHHLDKSKLNIKAAISFTGILFDFYLFYIVDNRIYKEIFTATQYSVKLLHSTVWSYTRTKALCQRSRHPLWN